MPLRLGHILLGAAALLLGAPASAQTLSSKPIRIVVPVSAGRRDRHPGAHRRRLARQADRAHHRGREPHRRRRQRRARAGRQGRARWPHAAGRDQRCHHHQSRDVQARSGRHPHRRGAGRGAGRGSAGPRRSAAKCRRAPRRTSSRSPRRGRARSTTARPVPARRRILRSRCSRSLPASTWCTFPIAASRRR